MHSVLGATTTDARAHRVMAIDRVRIGNGHLAAVRAIDRHRAPEQVKQRRFVPSRRIAQRPVRVGHSHITPYRAASSQSPERFS